MAPEPEPSSGVGDRDVVVFAGQDWWTHGRAHCDFQVARELARGRKVLVVNSIGMRMPLPGATDVPLERVWRKVRSIGRFARRPMPAEHPGLWVLSPVSVPLYGRRWTRAANARAVASQVGLAVKALGLRDPLTIAVVPTSIDVIERLPTRELFYYRADDHAAADDVDAALIRSMEDRLIARSSRVLYSSRALLQREEVRVGDKGVLVDHGVDLGHFRPAPTAPEPEDLASIPHPRIGLFGQLEHRSVDFELLGRLADELPEAHLVLIGRMAAGEVQHLPSLPNVHLLGWRDYESIPSYGRGFDVALLALPVSEWVAAANPIKLKEYLALGVPVVSTRSPELEHYGEVVGLADSHEEFVAAVRKALEGGAAGTPASRRDHVLGDGWDVRAALVERLWAEVARGEVAAGERADTPPAANASTAHESTLQRLVKVAISVPVYLADQVGGLLAPPLRRERRASGVVLLYHEIPERARRRFARQLDVIRRLGRVVALDELLGAPPGEWRLAITFDDGLESFATQALPELAARRIPSVNFVPSANLGLPPAWSGEDMGYPEPILTADQLRRLPELVEVGSHTRTHARLSELGADDREREISGSRHELEEALGGEVRYLSFPFGDWTADAVDRSRRAGYHRVFTVSPTPTRPSDDYVVGRVTVTPDDWPIELRLKALGAYRWLGAYMALKQRRRSARTTGER